VNTRNDSDVGLVSIEVDLYFVNLVTFFQSFNFHPTVQIFYSFVQKKCSLEK
jgi:hypothetical protein